MFKSYFPKGVGIILASILVGWSGCSSPAGSDSPPDLRALLAGLPSPPGLKIGAAKAMTDTPSGDLIYQPSETGVVSGIPVTYKVTTQKFKASAAFDTQVLLNPSADVIYPGSVLLGHTIDDGSFQEVTLGTKRPVAVSFDLTGVTDSEKKPGTVSGTIVPTLDAYRNLRNTIFTQNIPKQTSIYSYEMTEVNDQTEFELKLRAGASFSGGVYESTIRGGFDFNTSNTKHKLMIRFMQTFYTVDISQGNGTFLYSNFNLADFKGYRPVYVSSVAYGRLAYMTIESAQDTTSIKANLDVVFSGAGNSGDVAVQAAANFLKANTKTNITVIGGNNIALDLDSFMTMLTQDSFSDINAGKIVAYKLRFVDDNSVANTIFNGEYTCRTVQMVQGRGIDVGMRVTNVNCQVNDGGGNAELYGQVTYSYGAQTADLWRYSTGGTYDCPQHSSINPYNGVIQTFNFPSETSQLSIDIPFFREEDTFSDDKFHSAPLTYTVSQIQTGKDLKIVAYYNDNSGEWVEFTITPTVTYLY